MYGSNWQNEAGEPYMTASQLAFEAALDEQSAAERYEDDFYNDYDGSYDPDECENCGSDEHPTDECDVEPDEGDPMEDQWLDSYMEDRLSTMYEG